MIAAGKYDYVNPDISSTNFPINKVKSGTENLEAMIFYIDKSVAKEKDFLKILDRNNLRLGTLPELLALGERYPELQNGFWINAPGSRLASTVRWDVPCLLSWGDGERSLRLSWRGYEWGGDCRFLAFRK